MSRAGPHVPVRVLVALLVGLVSVGVRVANEARLVEGPGVDGPWATIDPDGHYHMRRVARALEEGGAVAATDPRLAHPDGGEGGTAIPWPPYATHLAWAIAAPFAPESEAERRDHVERVVGSLSMVWSALASVVVALAAAALVREGRRGPSVDGAPTEEGIVPAEAAAALAAGLYHACAFGSVRYGHWGNGDHHALVALLEAGLFATVAVGLARGWRLRGGLVAGAILGVALGTWVPAALFGLLAGLAVGLGAWRDGAPGRDATHLGTGLCGGALLAVAPAVLASPWPDDTWLNLSQRHAQCLVTGLLVFRLAAWTRTTGQRRAVLGSAVALSVALLVGPDSAVGAGLREGLEWSGASNAFMGRIQESQSLPWFGWMTWKWLGLGVLVAPVLLLASALGAWRGRSALGVWAVALVGTLPLAFAQRRFGEAAVLPLAVLLGWGGVALWQRRFGDRGRLVLLVGTLGLLANASTAWRSAQRLVAFGDLGETPAMQRHRGLRELAGLLREVEGEGAVLAHWDRGHLIEWVGGRPTVATGFGSYVGADALLDPWRFFLETDPGTAEARLARRDVRFVLVDCPATTHLASMVGALHPEAVDLWTDSATAGTAPWSETMAARLGDGDPGDTGAGLGFLRLIAHSPHGRLFERVAGARVTAEGAPGSVLELTVRAPMIPGGGTIVPWTRTERVGADGRVTVRVPYASAEDGTGSLSWRLGDRSGRISVSPEAVATGATIELR